MRAYLERHKISAIGSPYLTEVGEYGELPPKKSRILAEAFLGDIPFLIEKDVFRLAGWSEVIPRQERRAPIGHNLHSNRAQLSQNINGRQKFLDSRNLFHVMSSTPSSGL